ncbi:hypothetical protein evm_011591 [Chilo suppressalis]|nr:hypothetical protein evm_011591 [Chilo suppressalis]
MSWKAQVLLRIRLNIFMFYNITNFGLYKYSTVMDGRLRLFFTVVLIQTLCVNDSSESWDDFVNSLKDFGKKVEKFGEGVGKDMNQAASDVGKWFDGVIHPKKYK